MAKKKETMSEGKRNIIAALLDEYDIPAADAYKKLNRQRSVFPSDKALLKALYLSTLQATKK